jgi:hypothetical protein
MPKKIQSPGPVPPALLKMSINNHTRLKTQQRQKARNMIAKVKKMHPLQATHNNLTRKLANLRKQNSAKKFVMINHTNLNGYNNKSKSNPKTKKKRSLFSRSRSRSSSRR